MSGPAKWKRSVARWIRRLGRSPIGMRIPPDLKRRGVDLAKRVIGDETLQTRTERTGAGRLRRSTGIVVGVDGAESDAFRRLDVTVVDLRATELDAVGHLDLLATARPSTWRSDPARVEFCERLVPAVLDVRAEAAPVPMDVTPRGFDRRHHERYLVIDARSGAESSGSHVPGLPPGRTAAVVDPTELDRVPVNERTARVQDHLALLDRAERWSDPRERASMLVLCAATGLPVVVDDLDAPGADVRPFLPARVVDALASVRAADVLDPLERTRSAARQWAAVHDELDVTAVLDRALRSAGRLGVPRPTVTVVVATIRPDQIDNWAPQIAVQEGVEFECVAVLHGDEFSRADEDRVSDLLGDRVTILRAPPTHRLGELLDAGASVASGDLIVKWDDDDLYDRRHLADLARAHRYSRATIVGKACDFVHLVGPDVTVHRDQGRRETFSATVAGGTLCIARGTLHELGGWPRASRRVDSLLIERVLDAGGTCYRSVGFGYVMRRESGTGHAHTWQVGDDHFLRPDYEQRRGLDLAFAGVDTVAEVVERWGP